MPSVHDEIRARIDAFITDLATLVRTTAVEAVHQALGGVSAAVVIPVAAMPQKKTRTQAARRPAAATAPAPRAAKRRAPGEKRNPGEIQGLVDKLASYIGGHPGETMETIRDALATASTDLAVPAKKLIAAGKIRAEGEKQFTRYFPVSASG